MTGSTAFLEFAIVLSLMATCPFPAAIPARAATDHTRPDHRFVDRLIQAVAPSLEKAGVRERARWAEALAMAGARSEALEMIETVEQTRWMLRTAEIFDALGETSAADRVLDLAWETMEADRARGRSASNALSSFALDALDLGRRSLALRSLRVLETTPSKREHTLAHGYARLGMTREALAAAKEWARDRTAFGRSRLKNTQPRIRSTYRELLDRSLAELVPSIVEILARNGAAAEVRRAALSLDHGLQRSKAILAVAKVEVEQGNGQAAVNLFRQDVTADYIDGEKILQALGCHGEFKIGLIVVGTILKPTYQSWGLRELVESLADAGHLAKAEAVLARGSPSQQRYMATLGVAESALNQGNERTADRLATWLLKSEFKTLGNALRLAAVLERLGRSDEADPVADSYFYLPLNRELSTIAGDLIGPGRSGKLAAAIAIWKRILLPIDDYRRPAGSPNLVRPVRVWTKSLVAGGYLPVLRERFDRIGHAGTRNDKGVGLLWRLGWALHLIGEKESALSVFMEASRKLRTSTDSTEAVKYARAFQRVGRRVSVLSNRNLLSHGVPLSRYDLLGCDGDCRAVAYDPALVETIVLLSLGEQESARRLISQVFEGAAIGPDSSKIIPPLAAWADMPELALGGAERIKNPRDRGSALYLAVHGFLAAGDLEAAWQTASVLRSAKAKVWAFASILESYAQTKNAAVEDARRRLEQRWPRSSLIHCF